MNHYLTTMVTRARALGRALVALLPRLQPTTWWVVVLLWVLALGLARGLSSVL